MPKLAVITGYTGVGKTELAIKLAREVDAEIVSCDSLLIYKFLDIGTAKPTLKDRQNVPHYCVNLIDPSKNFDIQQYIIHAKQAINSIIERKKNVLIVGGTGFYLKSFFSPVIDDIPITEEAKKFVDEALKNGTPQVLVSKLLGLNNGKVDVDLKNIRRVSAALKRCLSSGLTCEQINKKFQKKQPAFSEYQKYTVLLIRDDDDLKNRICARVGDMFEAGLINEVKGLLKNNQFNSINRTAIGYRETIAWLANKTTIGSLKEEIVNDTWKLVKKQKTWFKKQIPIDLQVNLSEGDQFDVIQRNVKAFLNV